MTVAVGISNKAFVGFPKGYDAYGHMSKVKFLVDNFPNTDWNYEWYSGQFFSEGSFPPLFHVVATVLVGWFGFPLGESLIFLAAASFVVIACSLYGLVRLATGSRLAGLIAASLLLATNAFWSYVLLGGLYPRIVGMAFVALAAFFAFLYSAHRSRAAFAAMIISVAGALSTHLLLGAIGLALSLMIVATMPVTATQRLKAAAALVVTAGLVVGYFYLPYALTLTRPGPVPLLTREYVAASSATVLGGTDIASLPIFLIPGAIAVAVAVRLRPRMLPVFAISALASMTYVLVGLVVPGVFIYNFQPYQAVFFAAWFLAAVVGLALGGLRLPRWAMPLIAIAALAFVALSPTRISTGVVSGDNAAKAQIESALHVDPTDRQHRVGVSWDAASDWIDARSGVPQTRGYQQQGVVEADWQYWLESRLWSAEANYDEKNFLLDWYAIQSFYGGPDPRVVQRFADRPDLYRPSDATGQTFDYRRATEILTARTTRSALVIGSDQAYGYLLHALSLSDMDSTSLIPVRGADDLDDHALNELRQFDLVVLYGYQARDLAGSFARLEEYVRAGGNLLIEANNSPLAKAVSAPAPIPGTSIQIARIGPAWNLSVADPQIAGGIGLASFAPATYNGGSWGISYIPQASISAWAHPVLLSDGRPVMVAGTLGAGHVLWSGMNLPYHAASTVNREESRLLGKAIAWTAPTERPPSDFKAEFVNPELRRVTVDSAGTGVLLKENWVPNWVATVNGRAAPIYRAGPDFMYVPIATGSATPAIVEFRFTRTVVEWTGDAISVLALIGLLGWLVWPRVRRRV